MNKEYILLSDNEVIVSDEKGKMQSKYFNDNHKPLEAERIEQRTKYDLEMLAETGFCRGVENYSRHLSLREEGETPECLIDFFPKDFLLVIDESHVTVPQIGGMYNGDRARKMNLVDYGFRLPSALDNRPLKFNEFESKLNQTIYVSATPGDYELDLVNNHVVEQIIRPTGLLDPTIEIRKTEGQIDDVINEIKDRISKNERTLITTLTIRMAEELTNYLKSLDIKVAYLHTEIKTLERLQIIRDLRLGKYDVLVGINLLREGLDIPEISLVAILDADKEGFLRNERSLTQTVGRAARNVHGRAIMYADKITGSMQRTIEETERRRLKQMRYNEENGITPQQIKKKRNSLLDNEELKQTREMFSVNTPAQSSKQTSAASSSNRMVADKTEIEMHSVPFLEAEIERTKEKMMAAAKALDFMEAAHLRDYMLMLQERVEKMKV